AYCRFFGRRREELVGQKFLELIPESSRRAALEHVSSLIKNPRTYEYQHEVSMPDGTTRWQQWVDHAIVGPDGRVTEFQGIGRDITDRKAAEELLRQSDERFQLVLRSTNAVIYDWDMVTDTLWWSPNGLKLFGYEPRDR